MGTTRQVRVTVKWRRISSGRYSREWCHSAGHWAWLSKRSISARSFASNRFVISVKCMKMRSRALGVTYRRKAMCGHCGFVLVLGERWTSIISFAGEWRGSVQLYNPRCGRLGHISGPWKYVYIGASTITLQYPL